VDACRRSVTNLGSCPCKFATTTNDSARRNRQIEKPKSGRILELLTEHRKSLGSVESLRGRWISNGSRKQAAALWVSRNGNSSKPYAVDRQWSMAGAVEGNVVGRAVRTLMTRHRKGFAGQMSVLLRKLDTPEFRGFTVPKNWPVDATRLSTELTRLIKPFAGIGINCAVRVDRRNAGGTQFDVILSWTPGSEPPPK
jgi:hypothetical protein